MVTDKSTTGDNVEGLGTREGRGTPASDKDYKLYCFDARGNRLPAETVDAPDDATAMAIVRLHLHKRCELWQAGRLVLSIPEGRRGD